MKQARNKEGTGKDVCQRLALGTLSWRVIILFKLDIWVFEAGSGKIQWHTCQNFLKYCDKKEDFNELEAKWMQRMLKFDLRPQALYFCLVSNVQEDVRLLTAQVGRLSSDLNHRSVMKLKWLVVWSLRFFQTCLGPCNTHLPRLAVQIKSKESKKRASGRVWGLECQITRWTSRISSPGCGAKTWVQANSRRMSSHWTTANMHWWCY